MVQTTARIKKAGLHFEILVDLEEALAFKKGLAESLDVHGDRIFTNCKKGDLASTNDLEISFGTANVDEVARKIIKSGEILVDKEHRNIEQEQKVKQVVDFLVTNATNPQTGNPHTAERIRSSLREAHVNIKNVPIEQQMPDIIGQISRIIPIKIATKRVKIIIPAMHTGKAYGVITQYKEEEIWKDNGDLEVTVNVPSGIIIDFYEKLNGVTHGSALTEELAE